MKTPLILLMLFFTLAGRAQSEKEWLAQAEKQQADLNENAALGSFQRVLQLNPNNYKALWKLAELYSRQGKHQPSRKAQQDYFAAAKRYAERAISINPNGADGYYGLAVALGRQAMTLSGKEKVNNVKDVYANIMKALRLNPNHARAWHVLGKWHYEVSNLGMLEKAALKLVYGGLPPASIAESIQAFEKAKQLEPDMAVHYFELAKALHSDGQDERAVRELRIIPTLPIKTTEDNRIRSDAAKFVREWN